MYTKKKVNFMVNLKIKQLLYQGFNVKTRKDSWQSDLLSKYLLQAK